MAEKESGREDETKPVSPRDWSGEYRLSGLKGRRLTIARLGPGTVGRWVGRTRHWHRFDTGIGTRNGTARGTGTGTSTSPSNSTSTANTNSTTSTSSTTSSTL